MKRSKPKIHLIFIFSVSIFFSCSKSNSFDGYETLKGGEVLIKIEDVPFEKLPYADSIMTVEKVVVLESGKETFIGTFDKISIIDDIIYIMDKSITYSIFAFDLEGKFLWKIADLGEGPEEYIELRDFTVSKDSETLDLLDYGGRKIMKFNKKTGELVEKIKLDFKSYASAIEKKDGLYLSSGDNACIKLVQCHNLLFLDQKFKVLSQSNPINPYLENYDYSNFMGFSRNGERVYFTELFNDTIYEVNTGEKKLAAAFVIDFGKYSIPHDMIYSKKNTGYGSLIDFKMNNPVTTGIHDYFVSDSFLFFRYGNPHLQNVIIDLNDNKSLSYNRSLIGNSLLHGEIKATYKNTFVKAISSEMIDKFLKEGFYGKDSLVFRERNPEFFEIIKDMDSSHNGIISFINFNLN
ncbi:6-bladed beta-propeller [Belliella aquatica]|uniref:6-bladed beta-propeller protein n=1 Tax=Belliella aquatica TaxID=1323734 RepID=A0ABQ1N0T4_9BACT|nr:BF3164 family lipoprotein [Belliella aquatica]MCH7403997.1 6-bladed beta-propeller [Belliella aquatica]GGC49984.1 hypothetical protein GCM10010993_30640 [Belliella aquatica]